MLKILILFSFFPLYSQGQTTSTGTDSAHYDTIPNLIKYAESQKDRQTADKLVDDYLDNYLLKKKDDKLYTPQNIGFIQEHIRNSSKGEFLLLYRNSGRVDNTMQRRNFTRDLICQVITRENIEPVLAQAFSTGLAPEWDALERKIASKFDAKYAALSIIDAKLIWYLHTKERAKFCRQVISRVDRYGPYGPISNIDWQFNSCAWDIFLYSDDKAELTKALQWCDSARSLSPTSNADYLDTRANLLYKLGRTKDAIVFEQQAIAVQPEQTGLKETLAKMKNGQPTWLP